MLLRTRLMVAALALGLLGLASIEVQAGDKKDKDAKNPPATPSPRMGKGGVPDAGWMKRHEGFVAIAKKGDVDLLLLGDSITDAWRGGGAKKAFTKHFAPRKTANFGIGGDRTQHVLWRIQNGELDGIKPKVVMLMIGTNNSGGDSAEQISEGITSIVRELRRTTPETKVLLLAVFPRGEKAGTPIRAKLAEINKTIARLDDGKSVFFRDIGEKFLEKDGTLSKKIMPDFLHLSEQGYNIWGEAVEETVQMLLGGRKD